MKHQDIFSYITQEEANYQLPIEVIDGYSWSMRDHIKQSTLYKNSKFTTGDDPNKPFKNIVRPILNLQYRAEGFDVKDIEPYIDDYEQFYKSFLVRKYHDKWAVEHGIDTFIDSLVESYCDYGGVLVKDVNSNAPEVVPLQSIVFCDQTDLISGPIGIKHFYSPDQLLEMEQYGWGNPDNGATATLDEIVMLAGNDKQYDKQTSVKAKTPGKYIEIYEVHGMFPQSFIDGEGTKYTRQMHIVTFLQSENGDKQGITLFAGKEKKSPFKFLARDVIYGRALGFGGIEELFQAQIWTNYSEIQKKAMLDAASKTIFKTTDPTFKSKNTLTNVKQNEVFEIEMGTDITQIDTTPRNINLFDNAINEWQVHAQQMGSANEAIMGEQPTSGTPFKLQELVTAEAHSLHEYRKGKIAVFVEDIYRDWIIPRMAREITLGDTFLAELDLKELTNIAENVMVNEANKIIKSKILDEGVIPTPEEIVQFKETARQDFMAIGNKRFIDIAKDEIKDVAMRVRVNVAGKQKDLFSRVDKLVNVFRQIIASPQMLQDPVLSDLFNQIIEASGLSPVDFTAIKLAPQVPTAPAGAQTTQPLQDLAQITNA